MNKEDKPKYNTTIKDIPDLICMIGLSFLIMLVGVLMLPKSPEHVQFWFSLSILASSIYFTKQIVFFIVNTYLNLKKNETK